MVALEATEEKLKVCSGLRGMYESIRNQLQFLVDYFEEKHDDLTRFNELSFGIIAVREIEDSDPEYAKLLKVAFYVASQTKSRKALSQEFINEHT
ncbi:hypothetical protein R50073_35650 [Maricurvus nonylphenolicus]